MKILICSDGSEQAERAIRLGATIAAACQAEVTLLGIVEAPGKDSPMLDSLKRGQALLADKRIQAELITKAGEPIAEIVKRTQETPYDLVVIGAVRKSSRGAFWMSSKSYKIIKEIKPPVLSVAGKTGPVKRILICSGGKPYIDAAVQLTGGIAKGVGASVVLLHVLPEPPAIYAGLARMDLSLENLLASRSELGVNLGQEKKMLEALSVPVEVHLRRGAVLGEILREIETGNYDLVVTGSAPSRLFQTYILGDVSREIVNRVNCAVLVVRSRWTPPNQPGPGLWWWGRPEAERKAE
jgi:nucleotide-binding universal stress UspA family protein